VGRTLLSANLEFAPTFGGQECPPHTLFFPIFRSGDLGYIGRLRPLLSLHNLKLHLVALL
jgi:hypothetical protein